ncbi:MAG: M20 metallopeptidase family protein, partial [Vulcanimicrobiaceae bacterium]
MTRHASSAGETPSSLALSRVQAMRREFHANPELSMQEHHTAAYVADRLRKLGIDDVREGVGDTGVVGILCGRLPGKTVLLRADMDALPIVEQTNAEYSSQVEGVMHACGHDAHTAMLLEGAELLVAQRHRIAGTVVLCFQPGEEGHNGAKRMIRDGLLTNPV